MKLNSLKDIFQHAARIWLTLWKQAILCYKFYSSLPITNLRNSYQTVVLQNTSKSLQGYGNLLTNLKEIKLYSYIKILPDVTSDFIVIREIWLISCVRKTVIWLKIVLLKQNILLGGIE